MKVATEVPVVPAGQVIKTDAEWAAMLTPEQFRVTRGKGTERPFCGTLLDNKKSGTYHCLCCDLPLFSSNSKFDSGTGWPSYWQPIDPAAIGTSTDFKLIYPRTECHCATCGLHQGHVFKDGPPPTGERWCINGAVLDFRPSE
jgi:peptide-methionine (R)-S-oxide reductase